MDVETFHGFMWDEGNRHKCQKHGVQPKEIEQAFFNGPGVFDDLAHSDMEKRFLAIGRSDQGRYIFIAFTRRAQGSATLIRPISARYMHQKEIEHYEQK
jgi:hypothetical protein